MKPRTVVTMAFGFSALIVACGAAGFRWNITDSIPRGLWLVEPMHNLSTKRGTLVAICPPASFIVRAVAASGMLPGGDCPISGVAPLLKPVAAIQGDSVRLQNGFPATVNGVAIANTTAKPGLPAWPDGEYIVQPGQVWLFSSYSPNSFDSRYFGPVELAYVRGQAVPLLVSGDVKEVLK